jgi:predicted metal-binding membrane protein
MLVGAWGLMAAAMMLPLLALPLDHVWERSAGRRRVRAVFLFLAGYGACWLLAGALLVPAAVALRAVAGGAASPLILAALVAVAWQASPWKQACLNACHRRPPLAAFGLAAERDAIAFGVTHGCVCVGGCWALMLLALCAPGSHLVGMAGVALFVLAERIERPAPRRWGLRRPTVAPAVLRNAVRGAFQQVHA